MAVIDDFIKAIAQVPGNAVKDVGNIVSGIGQVPGIVNNAIQNPSSIPGTLANMGSGFANEMNQFAGNPIKNVPLVGIQTPEQSLAQGQATIQHAQQHPVNTALDAASLVQAANAFQPKTSTIGKTIQQTGEGMTNDVNKIQLQPSLSGAAREQAVQDTVNNVVPGTTAAEKYANLQPTMKNLSDNIDTELTNNPKSVPIKDVKNAFMGNLSDQFRTKAITSEKAINEIDDYLNNLFRDSAEPIPANPPNLPIGGDQFGPSTQVGETVNGSKFVRMGGVKPGEVGPPGYLKEVSTGLPPIGEGNQYAVENPTSPYNPKPMGDIVPSDISTKDLFQMKVGANADYQNVLRKMNSGQPLSDTDKVISAARKTLDDIIAFEHPIVKNMTLQQSNLYDAIAPLAGARNANHAFNLFGTTVPSKVGEVLKSKVGGTLTNVGKTISNINPERNLVLAGEAANVLGQSSSSAPQNVGNESNNKETNNPDHTKGIISQPSRYTFQTPQQAGFLTTNDYTNQVNAIQSRLETEKLNNPQAAARDQQVLDQLNTSYNNQKPLRDSGTQLDKFMGVANMAIPIIDKAPTSLLNLNGSYNNLLNSTDPNYRSLGILLQEVEKQTGIKISNATNKESLIQNLDNAMAIMQNNYNAEVQQFFGGNSLNAGAPTQTNLPPITNVQPQPQGLPVSNGVVNVPFNFGGAGQNLPPIQ